MEETLIPQKKFAYVDSDQNVIVEINGSVKEENYVGPTNFDQHPVDHSNRVNTFKITPDGKYIIIVYDYKRTQFYDMRTYELLGTFLEPLDHDTPEHILISADGENILLAGSEVVAIYRYPTFADPRVPIDKTLLFKHRFVVRRGKYGRKYRWLKSCDLSLENTATPQQQHIVIALETNDGVIYTDIFKLAWDAIKFPEKPCISFRGDFLDSSNIKVSPWNSDEVFIRHPESVAVWGLESGQRKSITELGLFHPVMNCHNMELVLIDEKVHFVVAQAADEDLSSFVLSLYSPSISEPKMVFEGHKDVIYTFDISRSTQELISADRHSTVIIWDITTGASERILLHRGWSVCFVPFVYRPKGARVFRGAMIEEEEEEGGGDLKRPKHSLCLKCMGKV